MTISPWRREPKRTVLGKFTCRIMPAHLNKFPYVILCKLVLFNWPVLFFCTQTICGTFYFWDTAVCKGGIKLIQEQNKKNQRRSPKCLRSHIKCIYNIKIRSISTVVEPTKQQSEFLTLPPVVKDANIWGLDPACIRGGVRKLGD